MKKLAFIILVLAAYSIVISLMCCKNNPIDQELEEAIQIKIEEAGKQFKVAEKYFEDQNYEMATSHYKKSIEAFPTISAYLNLGLSLYNLSRYEEAEKVYLIGLARAVPKHQDEWIVGLLYNLHLVYRAQNKEEKAINVLEQALEHNPRKKQKKLIEERLELLKKE